MIEIRLSSERGYADHGWLQSFHTFSFASYYDQRYMGVSALRVINDDTVAPGEGFSTHSHQDMEIISYVKKGVIEHKDSMGNIERLPAGEFQLMSAGTGVTHSEYNPLTADSLEFLQIWIKPDEYGIEPQYQQKRFEPKTGLQLVISPDGRDGSLDVHQDAYLYQLLLNTGDDITYEITTGRSLYIHVVNGQLSVNGEILNIGDSATVNDINKVKFSGIMQSEALVFDLP